MSRTLFKYIFGMQLKTLFFVSAFTFCLIMLFDFAEAVRKFPVSNAEEFSFALKISVQRVPSTFCEILHYAYFLTATFCLWNLCNSHQITILKSLGKSPWQILSPFFCCATFVAALWLFVFHPLGLYSEKSYKESISRGNTTEEVNENLWINNKKNHEFIFIRKFHENSIEGLYIFNTQNRSRIFARNVSVESGGEWHLHNIALTEGDEIKRVDEMRIPGCIPADMVEILSKPPRKHNVYTLYKLMKIQRLEQLELRAYDLELNKLLVYCANFILFVLIAAAICFPINRYNTKINIAFKTIFYAVILRFVNEIFESFANNGMLPIGVAIWIVMAVFMCISIAILIWREV